jgi:hypothetical protein
MRVLFRVLAYPILIGKFRFRFEFSFKATNLTAR